MVPDAFGAYPAQRETPYWENPALRTNKGKIYSQSTGNKYIYKTNAGVKRKKTKNKRERGRGKDIYIYIIYLGERERERENGAA